MSSDHRTPVLVGVGQRTQRVDRGEPPLEPVDLIVEAARAAGADSGAEVLGAVDTVRTVALLSWRYRDAAALVAERLGLGEVATGVTSMGGNSPQALVNRTALDLREGRCEVALLGGAEAWRTRMAARARGEKPDWTRQGDDVEPAEVLGAELAMSHEAELAVGLGLPVQVYPLFETALAAHLDRSMALSRSCASELWAGLADVAAGNPHAWIRDDPSAEEIRDPSPDNRMIGYPYTKMMCANNAVEQSAAVLMTTAGRARELGIEPERLVHLLAGTDVHDHLFLSHRDELFSSPAVGMGGRDAFALAGIAVEDLEHVELYSCFPSAVQIGARELGLTVDRPLTVCGGLSFFGGPWNNYPMHAIASMVEVLRGDPGSTGLVWANGGYLTKHSFGLYSTAAPRDGFRHSSPQDQIDALASRPVAGDHVGPVTVEAWTVMHDRDGSPERAFFAARTPDRARCWATSTHGDVLAALTDEGRNDGWIGRRGQRSAEGVLAPAET